MTTTTISTIVIISKSVKILPDCCDTELNGPIIFLLEGIWVSMQSSLPLSQSSKYQSSRLPGLIVSLRKMGKFFKQTIHGRLNLSGHYM